VSQGSVPVNVLVVQGPVMAAAPDCLHGAALQSHTPLRGAAWSGLQPRRVTQLVSLRPLQAAPLRAAASARAPISTDAPLSGPLEWDRRYSPGSILDVSKQLRCLLPRGH